MIQLLRTFVGGFLMGSADLVPGVSGGTVALVLGIYERLISSVRAGSSALGSLLKGDLRPFREHLGEVEWRFLVPLLLGIVAAVISLASVIEHQLEENPTVMAGFFFGLVVGSLVIAWRLIRYPSGRHVITIALVGGALFTLLGAGGDRVISSPGLLAFFGAGALAICAMILPGISGSLLLLLIGMYSGVLASVNDRDITVLVVFVAGAIVGLALFSQALHWALRRHHDLVLAALIGLMAGSLRVVWPWPDGVDSAVLGAPGSDLWVVGLATLAGLVAVFAVSRLEPGDGVSEPLRKV